MDDVWFQNDSATCYIVRDSIQFSETSENFPENFSFQNFPENPNSRRNSPFHGIDVDATGFS